MRGWRCSLHFLSFLGILSSMLFTAGCKKNKDNTLVISGKVRSGQTGLTLEGVSVSIEKKSVQGGTYSATYTQAASAMSDGTGQFDLTFPRENFSELRIAATKPGYLTRYFPIPPDALSPETPYITLLDLFERSEIQVNIRSLAPFDPGDKLNFTFIRTAFDCACCTNGWQSFDAAQLDTTLNCLVYGNRWLQYEVQIYNSINDTIYRDSVYCPTGSSGELSLGY
jgi:hypothetical protein